MTEGPTQRKSRKTHGHSRCARCGRDSFNNKTKACSACGFGKTSRRND